MTIWKILGIKKTTEKSLIKKAYRKKLKTTRPDDDENAFMELRNAYEIALEYAEDNYEEDYYEDDFFEEAFEADEEEYNDSFEVTEYNHHESLLKDWESTVHTSLNDISRLNNPLYWKEFFCDSISYKLKYYEDCKEIMYRLCFENRKVFLPTEVWKKIDSFFGFSKNDIIAAQCDGGEEIRSINKTIKLNESIDFDAFENTDDFDVQYFCRTYINFMEMLTSDSRDSIECLSEALCECNAEYIPFECIKTAMEFGKLSIEESAECVRAVQDRYGENIYTKLLKAEYCIYIKDLDNARKILQQLYRQISPKNFTVIYQMAVCCRKVSMFYESYMLIKQLTWLNPKAYMHDMADELFEEMKSEYDRKLLEGESISDMEHIGMCRLYLRTYMERKKAPAVLERVNDKSHNTWEYNTARILCLFNLGKVDEAQECFNILDEYDKSSLYALEVLEYEELIARYLLMELELKECIDKCNELLEEYPISYPVLMIRYYADAEEYKNKHYKDYAWLNNIFPQRPEMVLHRTSRFDAVSGVKYLEPYKEQCEAEYKFCTIRLLAKKDYAQFTKQLIDLCKFIRDEEVSAADAYPFKTLDLKKIFWDTLEAVEYCTGKEQAGYFEVLESMKASKYNLPDQYVNSGWLYFYSEQKDKLTEFLRTANYTKFSGDNRARMLELSLKYCRLTKDIDFIHRIEAIAASLNDENLNYRLSEGFCHAYKACGNLLKAEEYAKKCIECGERGIKDYYPLFAVYSEQKESKESMEKAIELFEIMISKHGKFGDLSPTISFYSFLADVYTELGRYKEAAKAMDNSEKYTKSNSIQNGYSGKKYLVYKYAGEYDKAYDWLVKYEENTGKDMMLNKLPLAWKAERYREAYDILMEAEDEYDRENMMYASHCRFFEDGKPDMELIHKTYDETKMLLDNYEEADMIYNYLVMAEASYLLGYEKEYEYYLNTVKTCEWDDEDKRSILIQKLNIWIYIYQNELLKAYEITSRLPEDIEEKNFELGALKYHLNKMKEKGLL